LKADEAVLNATYHRFSESLNSVSGVDGIWTMSLEPLPHTFYTKHAKLNPFGFQDRAAPLVIAILTGSYNKAADDSTIKKATKKLMSAVEADAKLLNAWDPFLYINDVAPWQDPYATYGEKNMKRLRNIAKTVDPNEVFVHQVPGGVKFKR
jgi:hypothetical protein